MSKNPYLENQRIAGKLLTQLLWELRDKVSPGVNVLELEAYAEQFLRINSVLWAFKWQYGYPANLCLSVNDSVVHGAPRDYILQKWDVLKVDGGVKYKDGLADAAFSMVVWWDKENEQWAALIKVTHEALDLWLQYVKAGRSVYDFGFAVSQYVKSKWFTIIKNLTGHGIGKTLHEDPYVYNYGEPSAKQSFFKEWQVVCLEPITAIKSIKAVERYGVEHDLFCEKSDIGVQWEYMVLVGKNGPEILAGLVK
jgi:methionyl aminopeptidase